MIEVNNLKMSYGEKNVLKDISFKIKSGNIVGFLGVNGAGKTTTMNILTGYLKPSSGDVFICNQDMRKNPIEAKKFIGYLPEHPPVYKDMKVVEYLKFVAELKKVKNIKDEIERVLSLLNLTEKKYEFIKKLSKGFQQRVGLAQAIIGNPSVLILDEPLVGLDPAEAKKTRELIYSLKEDHAILISSHILSEIEELCNDILILKEGTLILNNTTINAKRSNNKKEYLVTVKGDREKIQLELEKFDALSEIKYIREKENGIYEFTGKSKNARDIRDSILGYMVSKKLSVYEIKMVETSLEDVFVEINSKEDK